MAEPTQPDAESRWLRYALLLLLIEKVIQHVVVSLAFCFNWWNIASTVVVPPTVLLVLGTMAAILFSVAFWALAVRKKWAANLILGLALFDIVGEFVAQGTLAITLNVSWLVAVVLLFLALLYKRRVPTSGRKAP